MSVLQMVELISTIISTVLLLCTRFATNWPQLHIYIQTKQNLDKIEMILSKNMVVTINFELLFGVALSSSVVK